MAEPSGRAPPASDGYGLNIDRAAARGAGSGVATTSGARSGGGAGETTGAVRAGATGTETVGATGTETVGATGTETVGTTGTETGPDAAGTSGAGTPAGLVAAGVGPGAALIAPAVVPAASCAVVSGVAGLLGAAAALVTALVVAMLPAAAVAALPDAAAALVTLVGVAALVAAVLPAAAVAALLGASATLVAALLAAAASAVALFGAGSSLVAFVGVVALFAASLVAASGGVALLVVAGSLVLPAVTLADGRAAAVGSRSVVDAPGGDAGDEDVDAGTGVVTVVVAAAGMAGVELEARPAGGTKLVARAWVLAWASLPGRTGAENVVERAGSPSTRATGIGPLRACAGGGAAPGRSVSLSSPAFVPLRGSSFDPRAGGVTGAEARMVSCNKPVLARGAGRGLSGTGGAAGATGAGPTLVISRAATVGAGGRVSRLAAGRDSLLTGLAGGRSLLAGRGGGPTRVISAWGARPVARVMLPGGCGLAERGLAARLSDETGCCGGTLAGRRFDVGALGGAGLADASSSSSTEIAGYDSLSDDRGVAQPDAPGSSLSTTAAAGIVVAAASDCATSIGTGAGVTDEGSEIRSAIGPDRDPCI